MNFETIAINLISELSEAEAELISTALMSYQAARVTAKETKKTADVKALESATRQLQKLIDKHTKAETFKSASSVHDYLAKQGYKISVSSLYNHIEEGLLKKTGGKYPKSQVDEYASANLVKADSDGFANQKVKAEIEQKNARTDLIKMQLQEKMGELISRERVGQEFSARIFTLSRDLDRVAETVAMLVVGKNQIDIKRIIREQHLHVMKKYARELECLK